MSLILFNLSSYIQLRLFNIRVSIYKFFRDCLALIKSRLFDLFLNFSLNKFETNLKNDKVFKAKEISFFFLYVYDSFQLL